MHLCRRPERREALEQRPGGEKNAQASIGNTGQIAHSTSTFQQSTGRSKVNCTMVMMVAQSVSRNRQARLLILSELRDVAQDQGLGRAKHWRAPPGHPLISLYAGSSAIDKRTKCCGWTTYRRPDQDRAVPRGEAHNSSCMRYSSREIQSAAALLTQSMHLADSSLVCVGTRNQACRRQGTLHTAITDRPLFPVRARP